MNQSRSHRVLKRYLMLGLTLVGALLLGSLSVVLAQEPVEDPPLPDTLHLGAPPASISTALIGAASADATASAVDALPEPAAPVTLPSEVWRIGIIIDGLYALDYETLDAAGVPLDQPENLHLSWRGQPVSLDRSDVEDGTFSPGEALIFYGEKFHGSTQDEKYTDENVYWLSVGSESPTATVTTRDVTPNGAPAAVGCLATTPPGADVIHWGRWSNDPRTATTWFEKRIPTTSKVTETLSVTLNKPVVPMTSTLVVEVASKSTGIHAMRLTLNDAYLGSWTWEGNVGKVVTATVPTDSLKDGDNDLHIFLDELAGTVYFDRAQLTYVREPLAQEDTLTCGVPADSPATYTFTGIHEGAALYDVTDSLDPVRLTGAQVNGDQRIFSDKPTQGTRYLAETPRPVEVTQYTPDLSLLNPDEGADELIVAPKHFHDALQPLIDHRVGQGLRVKIVAVEDIYPLFNGGIFHPEAIRSLVAYAYTHWPGEALQYLFLVGDGHFDFKGYYRAGFEAENPGEGYPEVWIPPYLAFEDPDQGEVGVDARFGDILTETLEGQSVGYYFVPEVAVGRIPAATLTEVEGYVAKLQAYENGPSAPWHTRSLLVADNGYKYDEGFTFILENLRRQFLHDYLLVDTVYMQDFCALDFTNPTADCPQASQALIDGWNTGASLMIYAGHGSINRWAHEPLIYNSDLTALLQTEKLPFLMSMDCWDGNWFFPPSYAGIDDTRSIGEWVTTVLTDSGAIAAFSPAALAYSSLEEAIAQGVLGAIFEQGETRLGPITQAGREAIPWSYLARTYTLLGDPAAQLRINTTPLKRVFLPLVLR